MEHAANIIRVQEWWLFMHNARALLSWWRGHLWGCSAMQGWRTSMEVDLSPFFAVPTLFVAAFPAPMPYFQGSHLAISGLGEELRASH